MIDNDQPNTYTINFQRILNASATFQPYVCDTATQIVASGGYYSVSKWLEHQTNEELGIILSDADKLLEAIEMNQPLTTVESLVILSMMLTYSEGVDITSMEDGYNLTNRLVSLVSLEMLSRRGLVDFNRAAATMSDQNDDIVIATRRRPG